MPRCVWVEVTSGPTFRACRGTVASGARCSVAVVNVLGYVRVSTPSQMAKTQSLVIQTTTIAQECARRGWTLIGVVNDPAKSAGSLDRPALHSALRRLAAGEAGH